MPVPHVDLVDTLVGRDCCRQTLTEDPSVVHDGDEFGEAECNVHVMLNEDNGD
jgi:hypothetical protein